MRKILFINDDICCSLEQLRDIFSDALVPGTTLYEDLLTLQRDGELARWLSEGDSEDEIKISKMLNDLPIDISNSELVNRLKKIFVGNAQKIQKPHFSNYIKLQQIRCLANDSAVELVYEPSKYNNLLKNHPHYSKQYKEVETLKVYEGYIRRQSDKECRIKLFLDFKITKADNEEFEIYFHGTHILSLKGKSVGQIVTIESNPYMFITDHAFDLTIEKERIGIVILNEAEKKVRVGDVEIEMVYVEGGSFTMGATAEQGDAYSEETPKHQVTLSNFHIGKYEVTQALWQAVMSNNPSRFKGANRPVEQVSWDDCQEFICKLNNLTNAHFRLPTEAEWEYAARGGKQSRGFKYAGSNNLGSVAWYNNNSGNETHPVGQKSPNELGLYDMSGNVLEWCQDWFDNYSANSQTNPMGPSSGPGRVNRGGSWDGYVGWCRSSYRNTSTPSLRLSYLGLRLAL